MVRLARDYFIDTLKGNHAHDGAEDFFLGDLHVVLNVGEDGGRDEIASVTDAIASADKLCAFLAAGIDVAHDLVELGLIDLRTLLRLGIEGIADGAIAGAGSALCDEFVVDLFFHEDSRSGAAALAVIEEEAEVRAFHGFVNVHVGEDDVGALAAEFQRDALEIGFRGGFHDEMADFGGTGEGHFIDIHMIGDGRAGGGYCFDSESI